MIKNSPFFSARYPLAGQTKLFESTIEHKMEVIDRKGLRTPRQYFLMMFCPGIFDVFLTIFLTSIFTMYVLAYFLKALFFLENAKNIQLYKKFLQFTH